MDKNLIKYILATSLFLTFSAVTKAQIAQGGNFSLDKSAIAGGGGQNSSGGVFALDGVIGQSITGTGSAPSFSVRNGFFAPEIMAPTAANVNIEGRVQTEKGLGIRNVRVVLTESDGTVRSVTTGNFGVYRFSGISAGQIVIISVSAKKYSFVESVKVLSVNENVSDFDFTAIE